MVSISVTAHKRIPFAVNHGQDALAGTSLVGQWLRLQASRAGGMGPIPGQRTKVPHAVCLPPKERGVLAFLMLGYSGPSLWSPVFLTRFSPLGINSGKPAVIKITRGNYYLQASYSEKQCGGRGGS